MVHTGSDWFMLVRFWFIFGSFGSFGSPTQRTVGSWENHAYHCSSGSRVLHSRCAQQTRRPIPTCYISDVFGCISKDLPASLFGADKSVCGLAPFSFLFASRSSCKLLLPYSWDPLVPFWTTSTYSLACIGIEVVHTPLSPIAPIRGSRNEHTRIFDRCSRMWPCKCNRGSRTSQRFVIK